MYVEVERMKVNKIMEMLQMIYIEIVQCEEEWVMVNFQGNGEKWCYLKRKIKRGFREIFM